MTNFVKYTNLKMNIIKLNAIDSTNSYLKKLAKDKYLQNYTVVLANHQTTGRGQRGAVWVSEKGKNLLFSVLIGELSLKIHQQFYLSMAVALAVFEVCNAYVKKGLKIKWPNDILADNDKLAGILIENSLSGTYITRSIVGVGVNLNQENFPKSIGNASSLKLKSGVYIDRDEILEKMIEKIKFYIPYLERMEFDSLKKKYLKSLYKFEVPTMFEDLFGAVFLGKIIDVSVGGKLVLEMEGQAIRSFDIKEIKIAERKF